MVTSFGGLVYFGLQFNERETSALTKWLLAFPMFAALLAARGFTLAVFLKETLDNKEDKKDKSEWIGALIVLTFYLAANIAIFKLSQQDIVRSFLFGLSSTLIPAGYNNDKIFYQCPSQPFSDSVSTYTANPEPASISPQTFQIETSNNTTNKMRSGLFLILHCIVNTAMLSTCAIYISVTRDLSVESDNALVLSQMLAVIPGCFFTLARSILLLEKERPNFCHRYAWKLTRIIFAFIFGIIAYGSLIPALFWSLIWKVVVAATTDDEEDDD